METLIGFDQACSWKNVLNSLKFCDVVQEWEKHIPNITSWWQLSWVLCWFCLYILVNVGKLRQVIIELVPMWTWL
jgi:hypothetical protein